MNTNTTLSNGSRIQLNQRRAARAGMLSLLLLLTLPAVVQAQFGEYTYTNNYGIWTYSMYYGSITKYTGPGGDVPIPSVISNTPITSIGMAAFTYCPNLTGVTIPNSVTTIGFEAFWNCRNLTSITIPDSVIALGSDMFDGCTSLTNVTIGNGVPSIGSQMFYHCPLSRITLGTNLTTIEESAFLFIGSLTSITLPNSLTSIGDGAFAYCTGLTSVTIPDRVTNIASTAFSTCIGLTNVMIGNSVTNIGAQAFWNCGSVSAIYFKGNAPAVGSDVFGGNYPGPDPATVYYLPGTTGWGATLGGRPTAPWPPPTIQMSPQTQTVEAGSAVCLQVKASSLLPLLCLWYLNATNLISCTTNCEMELTNVQISQSGVYTVVVTNVSGAATSSPAMLNVIAAVERRPVWGVKVTGETGSLWNVDYADSLSPAPNWSTLGSVSLTSTSQYYFDLTLPLPPQRFYRAWQTGTPGVRPSLDLHLVPAITLTGSVGGFVRLDYINQFGPIDAWVTLDTITLTNTSQLYFDISAPGQPPRLYRLVPSP